MSVKSQTAVIRFGLGLRLGESVPADPIAWLQGQLAQAGAPPDGPTVEQALRARTEQQAMRQAEAAAQAAATPPSAPAAPPPPGPQPGPLTDMTRAENLAWATRRLTAEQPFRERLVDFWMNHFTVSRRNGAAAAIVGCLERDAIRPHVTGRFADMLVAVTTHPAMLIYLDNAASVGPNSPIGLRQRRGLNENLAREVLELHSLSPAGGYTQGDVQELARILTGLSVAGQQEPFGFVWRPQTHEPGEKSLLGRRFGEGQEQISAALRFLGSHPATYRHLAVKLARHFVADQPPPEAVRAVQQALQASEGDLGAACRALIALPQAWDPPLGKLRTPQDHVLAACRAVGLPPERADMVIGGLAALGQPLWNAPQPNGWGDVAAEWSGPEALMRRVDWMYTLAGRIGRVEPAAAVEAGLGPFAKAETVAAMRGAGSVRDAVTLMLASPEFMHR